MRWWRSTVATTALWMALAGTAAAQQAPGTEEQHGEGAGTRGEDDDVRLSIAVGTTFTYGNARNLSVNLGGDLQLRLGPHAFAAQVAWIYAIASQRDMTTFQFGNWSESVNNANWKLRYDYFITPEDAVFGVLRGRYDPFAQLTPRLGAQVGYLRNFVREENHRFWGEIGYDFTYDLFPMALTVAVDAMGMPILSTDRTLHSLRLFVGYDNHLSELLTYVMGFEALMRLDRPEHWRFEWTHQLRSKIEDWLLISLDVTARLDSLPPGQREAWNEAPMQPTQMFDLVATLNVVGTFDLYGEAAEEEEECEPCPDPVVCPEPEGEEEPAEEAVEEVEPATEEP